MRRKISAVLAALAVGLGVFAGGAAATAGPYFGITYDSKDPIKVFGQVQASVYWSGTAYGDFYGQVQVMRYTGTGWVGQGTISEYVFKNGVYYGGQTNDLKPCKGGAYTYLVRSRLRAGSAYTPWDNSAGKNIVC